VVRAKRRNPEVEALIRERLAYNPETGIVSWRVSHCSRTHAGEEAGSLDKRGYRSVRVAGVLIFSHLLAVFLQTGQWPEEVVDHRNGVKDDNRWANLRECTQTQNLRNRVKSKSKAIPYKGVFNNNGSFMARICVDRKMKYLGNYPDPEQAALAYNEAAVTHFGEFALLNEVPCAPVVS
jgi:hypothetical protein